MRVLFISLQECVDTIGLKCLHSYLLSKGHESVVLYLPSFHHGDESQLHAIGQFVERIRPGFIGFSLMSIEYNNACNVSRYIKGKFPSVPIVWGGIHPTVEPESCLAYADYVCIGEGERTVLDVAEALAANRDIRHTNNLCYIDNGRIKRNPLYPLIDDLDSLPRYDHLPVSSFILYRGEVAPLGRKLLRKYLRWSGTTYSLLTSRGCPFACTYCCNNFLSRLYGTRKIRRRGVPSVMDELQKAIIENPEIETINIQDSSFLIGDSEYIREFSAAYRKKVGRPFVARAIPAFVTADIIACLKDAGMSWITLGLQSGSDRVCEGVYRRNSLQADFLRAAHVVKDFNLAAFYDVILDNPFETMDDVYKTAETLMQTPKPFYVQFFSLALYCGTELYDRARRELPTYTMNWREKNYHYRHKSDINRIVRLSAYMSNKRVRKILDFYQRRPESPVLKISLRLMGWFSAMVFEPLMYFRVLKLSFGGSPWKTVRHIPLYFREGVIHYINQFVEKTYG